MQELGLSTSKVDYSPNSARLTTGALRIGPCGGHPVTPSFYEEVMVPLPETSSSSREWGQTCE